MPADEFEYLHMEPGDYDHTETTHIVDQQRALALDTIRTSDGVSVTYMHPDGGTTHWAYYGANDDDRQRDAFLLYATVRCALDLMAATGLDVEHALGLVAQAVKRGVE